MIFSLIFSLFSLLQYYFKRMRGHINRHYFLIISIILYYRHYLKVKWSVFLLLLLGLLLLLLLLINFYFCDSCSGWRSCRRSFWSTLWWTVQIWNVKHMEFPEVSAKVSRSWHMESDFDVHGAIDNDQVWILVHLFASK